MRRYSFLWMLFLSFSVAVAHGEEATTSVWLPVDEAASVLQTSVETFADTPTGENLQAAKKALSDVAAAWAAAEPHQDEAMIARRDARWVDSGEVAKADLNELIGASRCPVPFSRDMIRKLNADMQGIGVLNYLLSETPDGATDDAAVVALYLAQPRRAAYLKSTASLLKEKTAALLPAP